MVGRRRMRRLYIIRIEWQSGRGILRNHPGVEDRREECCLTERRQLIRRLRTSWLGARKGY